MRCSSDFIYHRLAVAKVYKGSGIFGSIPLPQAAFHLGQHHAGDTGQLQRLGVAKRHPVQAQQFPGTLWPLVHLALDKFGIGHEKAGIEAPIAIRRGNGARHQMERIQTGIDTEAQEVAPLGERDLSVGVCGSPSTSPVSS